MHGSYQPSDQQPVQTLYGYQDISQRDNRFQDYPNPNLNPNRFQDQAPLRQENSAREYQMNQDYQTLLRQCEGTVRQDIDFQRNHYQAPTRQDDPNLDYQRNYQSQVRQDDPNLEYQRNYQAPTRHDDRQVGTTVSHQFHRTTQVASASGPAPKSEDCVRVVSGINGTNHVDSWTTFNQVQFPPALIQSLTDGRVANFTKPTVVQAHTWPSLMAGLDVIGVAKTGSGKTLSFLLPGFIRVKQTNYDPYYNGPKIVVLAPTRELCQQIYDECEKFGKPNGILAAFAYGGSSKHEQLRLFRGGPHVAVACPGRFLDFLNKQEVKISNADYFVLDEADRMLDMGFEPDIRKIVKFLPTRRQNCLFSATWPREVQNVAQSICNRSAVHIEVGNSDGLTANSNITQNVHFVSRMSDKWRLLDRILLDNRRKTNDKGAVLVFSTTKRACADMARSIFRQLNVPASALHGDMDQKARDEALQRFKDGRDKVMVATDVAQRGLDVRNISVVVNWDAPQSSEDYVHRIGRTGRGGQRGESYIFLFKDEVRIARDIMKMMVKSGQEVSEEHKAVADGPIPPSTRGGPYGKGGGKKGRGKKDRDGKGGGSGFSKW